MTLIINPSISVAGKMERAYKVRLTSYFQTTTKIFYTLKTIKKVVLYIRRKFKRKL